MMKTIPLLWVLLVAPCRVWSAPVQVSLCDALNDMGRINGRLVQIRARLGAQGEMRLVEPQCERPVVVDGLKFPNWIALEEPGFRGMLHKTVAISLNRPAFDRLTEIWVRANRMHESVSVTVIGLFETRTPLSWLVNKRGMKEGENPGYLGFGGGGLAPAQIIVQDVTDIVVADEAAHK